MQPSDMIEPSGEKNVRPVTLGERLLGRNSSFVEHIHMDAPIRRTGFRLANTIFEKYAQGEIHTQIFPQLVLNKFFAFEEANRFPASHRIDSSGEENMGNGSGSVLPLSFDSSKVFPPNPTGVVPKVLPLNNLYGVSRSKMDRREISQSPTSSKSEPGIFQQSSLSPIFRKLTESLPRISSPKGEGVIQRQVAIPDSLSSPRGTMKQSGICEIGISSRVNTAGTEAKRRDSNGAPSVTVRNHLLSPSQGIVLPPLQWRPSVMKQMEPAAPSAWDQVSQRIFSYVETPMTVLHNKNRKTEPSSSWGGWGWMTEGQLGRNANDIPLANLANMIPQRQNHTNNNELPLEVERGHVATKALSTPTELTYIESTVDSTPARTISVPTVGLIPSQALAQVQENSPVLSDSKPSLSGQSHQEIPKTTLSIPAIAEQVSRILERQLIVERERRGIFT